MEFVASKNTINGLLSMNCSYLIPKNQRKYVWSETEWTELFEDIFLISQDNDYAHFIGSFVFSKTKIPFKFEVIDGQQRLITISILFCCLCDELFDISETDAASSIFNSYLFGNDDGEGFYKITRDDGIFFLTSLIKELENSKPINFELIEVKFKNDFPAKDKYNEKVFKCYKFFKDKIEKYIQEKGNKKALLLKMKDKLIKCECIVITVEKDFEGFRVFETLNARGIPLEQHEIIKNYFYSYLRNGEDLKELDLKWQKIINNTATEKGNYLSSFISHYCTHKFGKIKKSDEFRTIRDNTKKTEIHKLLDSIYKCSNYYSYIVNPETYKTKRKDLYAVYVSLDFFYSLNIRQVRPLILSLFEAFEDKKIINESAFIKSLSQLESFYFMYVILLKESTNKIDSSIISLSKRISDLNEHLDPCEIIKNELERYISEKDKIKNEFTMIGYSNKNKKFKNSANKKCVTYVLKKIENSLDSNDEMKAGDIPTIEHIYNDSENEDFASYIGNLLPLSKKLNNNAANKDFREKIEQYKKSNFRITKKFVARHETEDSWNEKSVKDRGVHLAEYCFDKIWDF